MTKPIKSRNSVTISCKQHIGDAFIKYAESQDLTFSAWATYELKKIIEKGQKV